MGTKFALLAGLAATTLLGSAASADAIRCGSRIVSMGDPSAKLLKLCGEPTSVQSRLARRTFVGDYGRFGTVIYPGFIEDVWIEEWTYNFGPYKLMRLVRIENGLVADVRQLGYGFAP